jgi:hypothetical protein
MANDRYYFDHDYNARNDDKILEMRSVYKAEGYGIFWMLVETMIENDNGGINTGLIGGLSHGFGVAKDWLSEFIRYCISIDLFYENEGFVYSRRVQKHKEFRKSFSEFGAAGAKKRWGGYSRANGGANAKERKGKEKDRGVKFSADGLLVYFEDGTSQELGPEQQRSYREGGYDPSYIRKGKIQ